MNLHPAIRALVLPASWVFGLIVRLRAWLHRSGILKQKRLNGVVISVGNLTVGGTGKTPFVAWLARELERSSERVGILTRGYRGTGNDSDEVQLLRGCLGEGIPIGVGADRAEKGRKLAAQGVTTFVLDDGLQHLALARDVDIVLVDATDAFGGGALLPAGRLREPKSALARADIVVITRADRAPALEAAIRRDSGAPIYYAKPVLEEIYPEQHSAVQKDHFEWMGKNVFAFCGIGNPKAFFEDAGRWGMAVVGRRAFPDHHRYSQADAREIERCALEAGAEALICTEKDTYNLLFARFRKLPLYACRVTMQIDRPDDFWHELYAIIERKREGKHR